jgi:hypothetical protein
MKTKFGRLYVKMLVDNDLLLIDNPDYADECLLTDGKMYGWTCEQTYNIGSTADIFTFTYSHNNKDLILINNYFFTGKLFIWNGDRD